METIIDCKKIRLSSGNVNSFHYLQCWGPVGDRGFNYLTSASLSATVIILPLLSFQSIQMNLFPQYKTPFYCFNFLYSWILLETSVWCSVIKQKRERENVAHIHFIFPKGAHFRIIQNALINEKCAIFPFPWLQECFFSWVSSGECLSLCLSLRNT